MSSVSDNKPLRELIAEAKAEVTEEIEEHKEEEEEEETEAHLVCSHLQNISLLGEVFTAEKFRFNVAGHIFLHQVLRPDVTNQLIGCHKVSFIHQQLCFY